MFLDREPYIRYWRPAYRVLGPFIRPVKGILVRNRPNKLSEIENRLARLEASQQEFQAAIEQLLLSVIKDRRSPEELKGVIQNEMATLAAGNAAQWEAIEQLLVASMGVSSRRFSSMENARGDAEVKRAGV
jgi:hypothetical protein